MKKKLGQERDRGTKATCSHLIDIGKIKSNQIRTRLYINGGCQYTCRRERKGKECYTCLRSDQRVRCRRSGIESNSYNCTTCKLVEMKAEKRDIRTRKHKSVIEQENKVKHGRHSVTWTRIRKRAKVGDAVRVCEIGDKVGYWYCMACKLCMDPHIQTLCHSPVSDASNSASAYCSVPRQV